MSPPATRRTDRVPSALRCKDVTKAASDYRSCATARWAPTSVADRTSTATVNAFKRFMKVSSVRPGSALPRFGAEAAQVANKPSDINMSGDFSVLGPVEVRREGTALPVGSGRERFVLALLLLNAGRLTPAGQLIDAMWTDPPASARAQLHNIISNLRRRLGQGPEGLIASRPSGYELSLGTHRLDLFEFRSDHALAMALFGEALGLWRGAALADVPDELAASIRQVLEEERLAAAESRLDTGIALGRFDEVLSDATALSSECPYREKLWRARMLALAGAGRRADALETYRHGAGCRRRCGGSNKRSPHATSNPQAACGPGR